MRYVFAVIIVFVGMFFVFIENEDRPRVIEPVATSDAFRDAYNEGCMDGANREYCDCTFNKLVDSLGRDGFISLSGRFLDDRMTDSDNRIFLESINACMDKF